MDSLRNVLGLCDGFSCGQIALRELGIGYEKYFASETDRHAIRQTRLNFPDTVQLGDIERWWNWNIDWHRVDLILAGTPCTGFSFAGKGLAFDDPQSRLFFVFADILNHVRKINPDVKFLLENVMMKKKHVQVISDIVGVYPVLINSSLVSAQNRKRYYWSNIRTERIGLFGELHTGIPQPKDRKIFLRDILETDVPEKYYLKGETLSRILNEHPAVNPQKAYCVSGKNNTASGSHARTMTLIDDVSDMDLILQLPRGKNSGGLHGEKSPTVSHNSFEQNNLVAQPKNGGIRVRRLTPTECARLQTIPEWYVWKCSDTQVYKLCGNGWTIEAIKHILRFIKYKK
jgi:DNA (cytosine-5)-methyltransferase 3A